MLAQTERSNEITLAIGSTNPIKIKALEEIIQQYPTLPLATITSFSVASEIADQPLSLEETILGAKNRAKNAFIMCGISRYSFGIESGLFQARGTNTGYLEACICCIYDGINYHVGLSCGFEVPSKILELVLTQKMNLEEACYHSGITTDIKLGASDGLIGLLSRGNITRKEYTKQSIITALIQLDNSQWYT